ncbi:hypothetical protein [Streptomyces sp. NPDC059175]|uniref:hypothetical protein n=1 Tax=unclassified Streptomyces TaxID=2593676 RepID=UPI00368BF747
MAAASVGTTRVERWRTAVEQQQGASEVAVTTRIGQAIMLLHGGDREEAGNRFRELWTQIGENGDPVHRCTLAHYLADTQDDPGDELAWDLRALSAAETLTNGDRAPRESLAAVRGLYPALHLSLAVDYLKLHHPQAARIHLERAREAVEVLADDGYGAGVRAEIDRLERRLAQE